MTIAGVIVHLAGGRHAVLAHHRRVPPARLPVPRREGGRRVADSGFPHVTRRGSSHAVKEQAHVCFETVLYRASILGTGGLGGTRGYWIPLRGPKRLIVGTDAFMVSAPQALREFVFRGRESSIAFGQVPSRLVDRDWILITGQDGGRPVQLAITQDHLPEVWQALAGTGAALMS